MIRRARTPAPKLKTLPEQKTDFTAEGSPPPGKVNTAIPVTEDKIKKATSRAPAVQSR